MVSGVTVYSATVEAQQYQDEMMMQGGTYADFVDRVAQATPVQRVSPSAIISIDNMYIMDPDEPLESQG
jgi:hypothetical protein